MVWSLHGYASFSQLLARRVKDIKNFAFLVCLAALGLSRAALADEDSSQWHELVRACEAVITDQSFAPLGNYEPAPFSAGLPDVKEYAVYNVPQDLVAIAKFVKGKWVQCLVRESDETQSRSRWRELANNWTNGFQAGFPKARYHWVKWNWNPHRPFPAALRCHNDSFVLIVIPTKRDL